MPEPNPIDFCDSQLHQIEGLSVRRCPVDHSTLRGQGSASASEPGRQGTPQGAVAYGVARKLSGGGSRLRGVTCRVPVCYFGWAKSIPGEAGMPAQNRAVLRRGGKSKDDAIAGAVPLFQRPVELVGQDADDAKAE